MKVSQLATLLDALVQGLDGVLTASHSKDAATFRDALRPFADQTIPAFAAFLGRCEEYQRTGVVMAKAPARARASAKAPSNPQRVPEAVAAVDELMRKTTETVVTQQHIDDLLRPFNAFTKPELERLANDLKIAGKPKTKADAIQKIRQLLESQARMADSARAIREG